MRITADLDDELLARARARFPPGTPKTVVLEEALRALLALGATPQRERPPELVGLIRDGLVTPASASGAPPHGPALMPLDEVMRGLAHDREDR